MGKIYVALMDNGSDDTIIHCLSTDPRVALRRLQDDFIEWRKDDIAELIAEGAVKDGMNPTLDEMSDVDAQIIEVVDGQTLYEQLRDWDFEDCDRLKSDDPRLK